MRCLQGTELLQRREGQCELCSGNILLLYVFMGIFAALVGVSLLVWNKFGAYISANYPLIIAAIFDTGRFKVIFASGQIIGSAPLCNVAPLQ